MTAPETTEIRGPRSDAVRNRALLIAAARTSFANCGSNATLEVIAKSAGVGIGTLYRHFPTRDALVEAVYRSEVEALCTAAQELLVTLPADEALAEWMQRFVSYVATKRGMADALRSMVASRVGLFDDCRLALVTAVETLLAAGARSGLVRSDIEASDLLRAIGGICLGSDEGALGGSSRRLVALLVDGLRYGVTEPS
jgi:AcrR family transcriptional regulator